MKILVYGINYEPELTGIGKYSGEMSRWFADNNNEVTVVTALPLIHISEPTRLRRLSYAVFCLKKKTSSA